MPALSPYADILAQREARLANRQPVPLKLRPSLLDPGSPSTRAIDARDARVAEAVAAANLLSAACEARGDYRAVYGYDANPFHSTSRKRGN
jgi:hypothetical protein